MLTKKMRIDRFDAKEFLFGDVKVGSQNAGEWNEMMMNHQSFSDTGTSETTRFFLRATSG